MAKQERLREAKQHGAAWFPFNIYPCTIPKDFPQVALHWQDSMELVFVKKGRGIVQAGLTTYTAQAPWPGRLGLQLGGAVPARGGGIQQDQRRGI